jgi:hypothetical protein
MPLDRSKVKMFSASRPHGLKGFIKIFLFITEDGFDEHIKTGVKFFDHQNNVFEVEDTMVISPSFALKFKNLSTVESVKPLQGVEFFINRADLSVEMIPQDLISCNVFCRISDGTVQFCGSVVDYEYNDKIDSVMILVANNEDILMYSFEEEFYDFSASENRVFVRNILS